MIIYFYTKDTKQNQLLVSFRQYALLNTNCYLMLFWLLCRYIRGDILAQIVTIWYKCTKALEMFHSRKLWAMVLSQNIFTQTHAFKSILYFSSVAQLCLTLCDPMDSSTPGFPVHHQLLELTQTQGHWVDDAIQSSNPLLSPSPLPSVIPSIRVFSNGSVLCIRWPKYWSFSFSISPSNNIQDWFPLGMTGWISLLSQGLSRIFSNTTVQKHPFFGTQLSL